MDDENIIPFPIEKKESSEVDGEGGEYIDNVIEFPAKKEEKQLTPLTLSDVDAINGIGHCIMALLSMVAVFTINSKELLSKIDERDENLSVDLKNLVLSLVDVHRKLILLLKTKEKQK